MNEWSSPRKVSPNPLHLILQPALSQAVVQTVGHEPEGRSWERERRGEGFQSGTRGGPWAGRKALGGDVEVKDHNS